MFTKNEKQKKKKSIKNTTKKTKQNSNITLRICRIKPNNKEKII